MALVAKESILVIILRGVLRHCALERVRCWSLLASADLVEPVIVADAEIHGQLSAVPRYLPSRKTC
jgi:hypothetical protein